jgi:hypothetical protein
LTVTTTAATSIAATDPRSVKPLMLASCGATLATVLLFGFPRRRRRWHSMLCVLMLLTLLAGTLGCGGLSNLVNGVTSNPGTTPGTYTLNVTGVSGTTTATGSITVTVL